MVPRVSIITATRSRPRELEQALRSSLAQEFGDFEHLVVDDASPEEEARGVIDALGDPRIRLIRLEQGAGPAGARNAALREATGEFVAILDDDDLMSPRRLARCVAFLDAHPDVVLVSGWPEVVDESGEVQTIVRTRTGEARIREVLPEHNPFFHSGCMMRTAAMRELGGYREALRYSHDYDMVLRLAEVGGIEILPEVIGRYRFHTANVSSGRAFLQGSYARVARLCAERRARGEPERLEEEVAAIRAPDDAGATPQSSRRAAARVQYQFGEWKFRDGRYKEARPHLLRAWRGEPFRPLCLGLLVASYSPAAVRRLFAPLCRRLVAARYPSWR
ncbi:MAG: glycosyltransferase [Planctomycetota bacterium]|jgi:glycosyltransferase involved in cell wall biosynthesis